MSGPCTIPTGPVLVVDDDEGLRELMRRLLGKAGIEAATAGDGAEALEMLGVRHYPVVVTDIVMPNKEGLETLMEVKQRWPHIKVVAMSGGGRVGPQSFLGIARRLGAEAVLEKPISGESLLAAVEPLLPRPGAEEREGV